MVRIINTWDDIWRNKTLLVKRHESVNEAEKIQEYFATDGRESFGEYLTNLQKKANETYLEAKKHPMETKQKKIQRTIRDYHKRIHKRGKK